MGINGCIETDHNLKSLLPTVNNGDGTLTFSSKDFSTYVILHESDINLSYYKNGLFPIYENSRIVYASQNDNLLTIKGYAFEVFKNYDKKNTFVRELIFLDKNDPSNPDKAYRIPLPAVYDPYLNKNTTLNPNGIYNYSYAYYGGVLDLNKVRKYTNSEKAPLVSLPKGEYLVYIRLSDGKRSNLLNLKNTKVEVKLPTSFKVNEKNEVSFIR